MNNLTVINHNGQLVTDSREVADMVDKQHRDLLESIRGYVKHLESGNFRSHDFFIESSYKNSQNKEQPCYLLTRKGCDMVANKMTGEKGVIFTATYVTRFGEMEKQLQKPACLEDVMIQSIMEMKDLRLQVEAVKQEGVETRQEIQDMRETVIIRPSETWRADTNKLVKKICYALNDYQKPKDEIYKALQERGACDLKRRLENMRARLLLNGATKSKADNLNYLDVIAEDKKLIEIYTAIVKEMAIKIIKK